MKKFTYLILIAAVVLGCSPESTDYSTLEGLSANAKGKTSEKAGNQKESLDAPVLTCGEATDTSLEITVTAGAKGAAGGFDIHWMSEEDFLANNSEWTEGTYCEMGFSGNGNEAYSLAPNESITLSLEDMMAETECGTVECGVAYIFRVRAKTEGGQGQQGGLKKSDWSENFVCASADCVCTYGKGYWRNHSNHNPGNQVDLWPVKELYLGSVLYNQDDMNSILDVPNNEGNNLVILSQHLIAAKLNVANGAGNLDIEATISDADGLIGGLVILEDSFPAEIKDQVNSLKDSLEAFNESHPCEDEEEGK